jgi:Na+/phosphate symporter
MTNDSHGVLVIIWPALIGLAGLIIFLICKPESPNPKELGRIMFFCGLLAVCFALLGSAFRF